MNERSMSPEDLVTRGIDLLRRTYGHRWFDHINLSKFNMNDGQWCIVGQVEQGAYPEKYADVENRAMAYGAGLGRMTLPHSKAYDYGFNVRFGDPDTVSEVWRRRIRNIRDTFGDQSVPEVEPTVWVDLTASKVTGEEVGPFKRVGGVRHTDGTLTFENEAGRFYTVPDVSFWFTDASDE